MLPLLVNLHDTGQDSVRVMRTADINLEHLYCYLYLNYNLI